MTYPTAAVNTANIDASGDSPASARSDILDAIQKLNQMIAHTTAFAATLLDDVNAATARATLGSTTVGDAVFTAVNAVDARIATDSSAPCFSAVQNVPQSLAASTWVKLQFPIKEFDTSSAFDNVINYRFQPHVAGYYQVSGGYGLLGSPGPLTVGIYKNGGLFKVIQYQINAITVYGSALIFLNGISDYIELWAYQGSPGGGALNTGGNSTGTYFQAAMVRAA